MCAMCRKHTLIPAISTCDFQSFFVLFSNFIKAGTGFNRLLRRFVRALFCHLLFFGLFFTAVGGETVAVVLFCYSCAASSPPLRSATDAADGSVLWFIAGSLWLKAHLSLAILWPCPPPPPTLSAPSPLWFLGRGSSPGRLGGRVCERVRQIGAGPEAMRRVSLFVVLVVAGGGGGWRGVPCVRVAEVLI